MCVEKLVALTLVLGIVIVLISCVLKISGG